MEHLYGRPLVSCKKLQHGDVVAFPKCPCGTHDDTTRLWVVLSISEKDIANGIDCSQPGLYAFGGMWYGKKKDNHNSYGKMIDVYWRRHRQKAYFFGTIDDFTAQGLKKLV